MLYLAYIAGHDLEVETPGPWRQLWPMGPDLVLVDTRESRSRVYHALKDAAPDDAALLVTACLEVPKFKGMAPGSLAWAREHLAAG